MSVRDKGVGRPKMKWLHLLFATGLATIILIIPSLAEASTVKSSFSRIDYDAVAGETNQVTVARSGANYVFTESGAVAIVATAPCVSALANVAVCPVAGIDTIDVWVDDLNDTASYDATIEAPVSRMTLDGGDGNDTLSGEGNVGGFLLGREGNDTITGSIGDDDVRAGGGNDTVATGVGDDVVFDGPGDDIVSAGPGRDRLIDDSTANGADVLDGGEGLSDSMDSRSRTKSLNVNFNGIADDGEAGEGDNLIGIEAIDTGSGNDTLTGGDEPNSLRSYAGDDVISGGPGPDNLDGGEGDDLVEGDGGNDSIRGGSGADQQNGGSGDDAFESEFFDNGADNTAGGAGLDTLVIDQDSLGRGVMVDLDGIADDGPVIPVPEAPLDNVGADIENLVSPELEADDLGLPSDDILTGNSSANQIEGGPGNDRISGRGGPDELIGGPGDDELDGGNGIDGIEGQGGDDSIRSRDSSADEIGCGSAFDSLLADSLDIISVTCDSSSTGARITSSKANLNQKGKARVTVKCPAAEGIACKVKINARKGNKTLAKGSGKVKSGKKAKVTLNLSKAGRNQSSNKLKTKATTTFTDAAGAKVKTSRKLVLRR